MNFLRIIKKGLFIMSLGFIFSSCNKNENNIVLKDCQIEKDEKFESAIIKISIASFNNLGFSLGDSVDVEFSNGSSYNDIPYYDGYYVKNGYPLVCAYPNNEYILITLNNTGIWDSAKLENTTTVTIKLNEKEKYLDTQNALGQTYSLEISDYTDKYEFANFRSLKGGLLKDDLIFRGASPVDNSRKRANVVDSILKEKNIKCVIDLADSKTNIESYIINTTYSFPYTKDLYDNNKMILLSMSSSYGSNTYKESVVKGFRFMLDNEGPYYIHCMEGKDRTGFVCLLVEALAGASVEELKEDYMSTYYNYYKISEKDTKKYDAIVNLYFNSFLEFLSSESDTNKLYELNYKNYVISYLKDGNMTDEEINSFISLITK